MRIGTAIAHIRRSSILIFVVTIVFLIYSALSVTNALERNSMINSIRSVLLERTIVRDEYFLYHEAKNRDLIERKIITFRELIAKATGRFAGKEDQAALGRIGEINNGIESIYLLLLSGNAASVSGAVPDALAVEREKRLLGQLLIKSYFINDELSSLERRQILDMTRNVQNSYLLIGSATLMALLLVMVTALLGSRFISKGLANLIKSARELAGGNLDYRLPAAGEDEIAEVARTMNGMAETLSNSFTSVGSLEKEMKKRALAEEEVKRLNADLEDRILRRTAQLDSANHELEAFAYSISHDLKAPLRSIQGFSAILEEEYGPALDAEAKRLLGIIRESANSLERLISDILSLSRVSRVELVRVVIDMSAMARETWDSLVPEEKRPFITFVLGELPPAEGDPTFIRQVWRNLLSNAIKYTSKTSGPVVRIGAERDEREMRYTVTDNGVGFDMAYSDKLFRLFQRLHSPKDFEGTGVGLAIVRRVVERHGGSVGGEGKVGEGASFWFSVPCRPIKAQEAGEEALRIATAGPPPIEGG